MAVCYVDDLQVSDKTLFVSKLMITAQKGQLQWGMLHLSSGLVKELRFLFLNEQMKKFVLQSLCLIFYLFSVLLVLSFLFLFLSLFDLELFLLSQNFLDCFRCFQDCPMMKPDLSKVSGFLRLLKEYFDYAF